MTGVPSSDHPRPHGKPSSPISSPFSRRRFGDLRCPTYSGPRGARPAARPALPAARPNTPPGSKNTAPPDGARRATAAAKAHLAAEPKPAARDRFSAARPTRLLPMLRVAPLLQSFGATARRLAVIAHPFDERLGASAPSTTASCPGGRGHRRAARRRGRGFSVNSTVGLAALSAGRGEGRRRRSHVPGRSRRFSGDPLPPDPELPATSCVLWWPDPDQARLSHPRGAGSGTAGIRRADGKRLLAALPRIDDTVR
jgi:hypothetical protein